MLVYKDVTLEAMLLKCWRMAKETSLPLSDRRAPRQVDKNAGRPYRTRPEPTSVP